MQNQETSQQSPEATLVEMQSLKKELQAELKRLEQWRSEATTRLNQLYQRAADACQQAKETVDIAERGKTDLKVLQEQIKEYRADIARSSIKFERFIEEKMRPNWFQRLLMRVGYGEKY